MSPKLQMNLLKFWHAWIGGAFLVAYLTSDDHTYAMHVFAGYTVLAAIAVRLIAGWLAPASGPLRLPRPSLRTAREWLENGKGRNPLFAWFAALLLIAIGLAGISGYLADRIKWLEDPHEAIAQGSLFVIIGHAGFVAFIYGGKRLLGRLQTA